MPCVQGMRVRSARQRKTTMARIYVGTYAKYNAGNLRGAWLDLDDYSDLQTFHDACKELHKDEADPELMFQDWEDIPTRFISESHLNDDVWPEWVDLSEAEREVFEAYLADGNDGDSSDAQDACRGSFDSELDFAHEHWEETGMLASIPKELQGYVDYEQWLVDMKAGGTFSFSTHNGKTWVFSQ